MKGMNEVLGPIYYVFAQHPDPKWKGTHAGENCLMHSLCWLMFVTVNVFLSEHAEADSFFCFTNLMTEVGDKFTKKLDFSHTGIGDSKIIIIL